MQERGEHIPPEESFDVARRAKEMYCYTCSDIVKVLSTSGMLLHVECLYTICFVVLQKIVDRYKRKFPLSFSADQGS
jgi:hypothetical protein